MTSEYAERLTRTTGRKLRDGAGAHKGGRLYLARHSDLGDNYLRAYRKLAGNVGDTIEVTPNGDVHFLCTH